MSEPHSTDGLLKASDSLERENEKLKVIVDKLMSRVERETVDRAQGFMHFERAIALEGEVQQRTHKLEEALDVLHATNATLAVAQREAEKARRDLSTSVESIQEGFAIFDANEKLVMKNSRFSALFEDVVSEIKRGISFEDYIRLTASSEHFFRPKNLSVENWVNRRIEVHKSNSVNFTLELKNDLWLQISEQSTPDGGTIVLQTDITDHTRLEREERAKILDQQAKIVKATLEHIEQGVLIFDADCKLVEWNHAAIEILKIPRRLARAGMRLTRFEHLFVPGFVFFADNQPQVVFEWACFGKGREVLRCELEAVNGFQYDVMGQEMADGSFLVSFNDVTKLRQTYKDLHQVNETLEQRVVERTDELRAARDFAERANASKSRFVAAASHDLLQPVNAAKLFISSLEHTELDQKQNSIVGRISKSFQSVESILGALLDISKLDSGQVNLNISDFSLDQIFDRLLDEFSDAAAEKGLKLTVVRSSARVNSDPVYLRRILQNLVSNAIRYTDTGRVLVGVRHHADRLDVHVIDTGIGIAPEEQELVFKEFHRSDPSQSSESAMGLGLAIVERACLMLEHDLALTSVVGEGTSICVTVPHAKQDELPVDTIEPNRDLPSSLQNALIMVVENDPSVRDAMERVLETWGAAPIIAASQQDAEAQIAELGLIPDIFLVDYHLDENKNGLELIKNLRAQHGPLLAILLTADRSTELERKAHSQGVFLRHKPLDIVDLQELVGRLLARRTPSQP
ncbi:PAS-domain containing protein [Aliiroseovarius sp. KMU-50]|uniref:histidine kinase n=1 Tax=Aliiroseovarius salicola TaxID=3009082 RepID=A0ABT4W2E1_9RHOB|nr:PAS-domain containing protein [Aliiroseovarius sp. KMU-50]MDA5094673.1 PAS-domain containing protein [Aliiroseovarius sp. KMU-50]